MDGQPVKHAASPGGTNHLAGVVELGPMQKWDPVEWAAHSVPLREAFC